MSFLCKAVLMTGYLYVLLATINTTQHMENHDNPDSAVNININNNKNNYLKRQLKKYHWRQYQLHQQQQQQQQHKQLDHSQTLEVPHTEPLFESSQELASSSGTKNHAVRHHSRSSSSHNHHISLSRNIVGAGDENSGIANGASQVNQSRNVGSRLLLQDRELRIEVFEDIIEKLLQLSHEGSTQRIPFASGMLSLALDPTNYELWKEGAQKLWQQQQRQLKLKNQQQAHKKPPRHSIYVCPKKDSSFKLACPGLNSLGATICIRDTELCDGIIHCPDGEDENSTVCMFYTMIRNAINKMTQTLFENLPRK